MPNPPRILLVEDDTDINNATARYLAARGCACTQAFSGTEGRLHWQAQPFDLIVADLMLPGLSGEALIQEIRQTSAVPVIVLSARAGLEDKVALLQTGADDYLTKPFALAELHADARPQLLQGKGLGQIVVRPHRKYRSKMDIQLQWYQILMK